MPPMTNEFQRTIAILSDIAGLPFPTDDLAEHEWPANALNHAKHFTGWALYHDSDKQIFSRETSAFIGALTRNMDEYNYHVNTCEVRQGADPQLIGQFAFSLDAATKKIGRIVHDANMQRIRESSTMTSDNYERTADLGNSVFSLNVILRDAGYHVALLNQAAIDEGRIIIEPIHGDVQKTPAGLDGALGSLENGPLNLSKLFTQHPDGTASISIDTIRAEGMLLPLQRLSGHQQELDSLHAGINKLRDNAYRFQTNIKDTGFKLRIPASVGMIMPEKGRSGI